MCHYAPQWVGIYVSLSEFVCACVLLESTVFVCVSAMVHCHHEPAGDLADRAHGTAAPRLPAEDPHQDCEGNTEPPQGGGIAHTGMWTVRVHAPSSPSPRLMFAPVSMSPRSAFPLLIEKVP